MNFDMDEFVKDTVRGGINHIWGGGRGSGKSHAAISFVQPLVEGKYPQLGNVACISNMIMLKTFSGGIRVGYPDNFFHVQTIADMFRKTGDLLHEFGMGNIKIILLLDEAQNFMLADQNSSPENQAMVRYMGITRKFGHCTMLLTPTERNLVPRIRNFEDDPNVPGYCGVLWKKDTVVASDFIRQYPGLGLKPRDITTMAMSSYDEPLPMMIPSTSWTTPCEKLRTGGYAYDTLSSASLSLGENFDIVKFINKCSGVASYELPDAISEYFDGVEAESEEEALEATEARIREEALMVDRMRADGIIWRKIANYLQQPESTIKLHYNNYFDRNPSRKISSESRDNNTIRSGSARVYIQPDKGGTEGDFERSSRRCNREEGGQCSS